VILHRVLPQRFEQRHQLLADFHIERRRHADVMEIAMLVIETEQERADAFTLAVLVPPEAGDDAVGGARVLDLEHRALARLV